MRWLRLHNDQGGSSVFVALVVPTVLLLAGLVIDGNLAIAHRQRAADIAEQAARSAANTLDIEALRGSAGHTAQVVIAEADMACARARRLVAEYADAWLGSCEIADSARRSARVRVLVRYQAVLLGLVTDPDFTASGTAVATVVTSSRGGQP